jgi:hypothetical protein
MIEAAEILNATSTPQYLCVCSGPNLMKLRFPNPCRSYDADKNCICFWGYDSTIEVSFFVKVGALSQLSPGMDSDETGFLKAFDSVLNRIHKAANKVYIKGGNGKGSYTYILDAKDF